MKVYVVTSLFESEDDGAEVNVLGIRKTKQQAYLLLTEELKNVKEIYEKNDIDYEIISGDDYVIVKTDDEEKITLEYQESEVE